MSEGWLNFIKLLWGKGNVPAMFGTLHLVAIAVLVCLAVGLVFLNKKINRKAYKYILLGVWIVLLVLEVFKQITISYNMLEDGTLINDYQWHNFPFHFCSMPIYILPFIVFMKENSIIKKRLELYGSIFFLFGGIIGAFIPSFVSVTWLNYQTLIHHSLMILVSILIALQNKKEFKFTNVVQTSLIHVGLLAIAIAINSIVANYAPESGFKINNFFIHWLYAPIIPVLKDAWNAMPYGAYFTLYILGTAFLTLLFYVVWSLILNRKVDFYLNKKSINKRVFSKEKDKVFAVTHYVINIAAGVFAFIVWLMIWMNKIDATLLFMVLPLCLLVSFFNKNHWLILIGEFITLLADVFLILLTKNDIGMGIFIFVQICYAIYLIRLEKNRTRHIVLGSIRTFLTIIMPIIAKLVLKDNCNLSVVFSMIYFSNLIMNLVHTICLKNWFLLAAFALFTMCDMFVGLNAILPAENPFRVFSGKINYQHLFYIPSQIMIAFYPHYLNNNKTR